MKNKKLHKIDDGIIGWFYKWFRPVSRMSLFVVYFWFGFLKLVGLSPASTFAGSIVTITGTPSVSGIFNYTVTTTGPCVNPTANGTITVTEDGTVTLSSAPGTDNQTVCINTPIVAITYAVGMFSTCVDS